MALWSGLPSLIGLLLATPSRLASPELSATSPHFEAGSAHFNAGNLEAAGREYMLGLASRPQCPHLHQALGLTSTKLLLQGTYPAFYAATAKYHLEQAVELGSPDLALSHRALGDVLQWHCAGLNMSSVSLQNSCRATNQQAAVHYRASLRLSPSYLPAIENYARMLLRDGSDDSEVLRLYRRGYAGRRGAPWTTDGMWGGAKAGKELELSDVLRWATGRELGRCNTCRGNRRMVARHKLVHDREQLEHLEAVGVLPGVLVREEVRRVSKLFRQLPDGGESVEWSLRGIYI